MNESDEFKEVLTEKIVEFIMLKEMEQSRFKSVLTSTGMVLSALVLSFNLLDRLSHILTSFTSIDRVIITFSVTILIGDLLNYKKTKDDLKSIMSTSLPYEKPLTIKKFIPLFFNFIVKDAFKELWKEKYNFLFLPMLFLYLDILRVSLDYIDNVFIYVMIFAFNSFVFSKLIYLIFKLLIIFKKIYFEIITDSKDRLTIAITILGTIITIIGII